MGEWSGVIEADREVCAACGGAGLIPHPFDGRNHNPTRCGCCDGVGFHGVDPFVPAPARPGSELKVAWMIARYAAGLELWDERDGVLIDG